MSDTEKFPIDWRFGVVQSGRREGWNDPAMAGFKENRLQALTREIIQNSMDARDKDKDKDGVARVRFQERTMPEAIIPNLNTLRDVLRKCSDDADDEPSDIKKEIEAVIKYARQDEIRVLSIKDTGTKGMPGPCETGKPFYRYLKASGQSGGEENRAGSHGIGKMAPLASSNIRAILISTIWKDEESGKLRGLIQGRANLRSYVSGEKLHEKLHEGVGYWGKGFDPIEPKESPYDWLCRDMKDGTGTTIHILGWSPTEKEWGDVILGYAAINFFAALERGKLEVCISQENCEDRILNKKNIKAIFENERIRKVMKRIGSLDKFKDSQFFHKCIADDEGVKSDTSLLNYFGKVSVRMIVEPGAPRKIAIIRNGMLITTYFKGFWKSGIPLKYKECGGVFKCHEEGKDKLRGNKLLRSMEPPAHNQLSSDFPPAEAQENARIALGSLSQYLRKKVEQFASYEVPPGSETDVMNEFLGDEGEDTDVEGRDTGSDPKGGFKIHPQSTECSESSPVDEDDLDNFDDMGEPDESPKQVHLLRRRVVKIGEKAVRVIIESAEDQEAYLMIHEVGEESVESFMIADKSGNMVRKLRISLKADEPVSLDLVLEREIVEDAMLFAELKFEKTASESEAQ